MTRVYNVLAREPVLLGAVLLAVGDATFREGSPWRAVVIAVVAWLVRMLSTPEARARKRIEEATAAGEEVGEAKAENALREFARAKRQARK